MTGEQSTKIIQIFEEALHVAANRTQSTLRHLLNQEVIIETPTVRYTESTLIDQGHDTISGLERSTEPGTEVFDCLFNPRRLALR